MKKLMIMAAMLSFAAACGGNTQNEKSEETVETVETVEVVETVETEAVATPEVEVAVEEKAEELPAIAPENENLKVQMPEKDKFTVSEIKEVKKIESIKMGDKNEKKALKVSDKTLETPGVQSTNLTVKK
jgi:hypothetical protein